MITITAIESSMIYHFYSYISWQRNTIQTHLQLCKLLIHQQRRQPVWSLYDDCVVDSKICWIVSW